MARFLIFARYVVAAILVLFGLRVLLKVVFAFFSGERSSSVEAFLLMQTLLIPCSLLAAAWLLIIRKHRAVAVTVLILSSLAWVPSIFRIHH